MATPARWLAIIAGVVGAAAAAALLVRDVVLEFNAGTVWRYPSWLTWLAAEPGAVRTYVAAGVASVGAVVCLWAAARMVRRPAPPLRKLDLGDAVAVDASTLERLLGNALPRRVPELESAKVQLSIQQGKDYCVRASVGMRACSDLTELHARLAEAVRDELHRAAGLEVARVTMDVEKFDVLLKGAP
jgi:hypothetical protein